MKKTLSILLLLIAHGSSLMAQTLAQKRVKNMKLGVNISYLDNYWNGTKNKHYADAFTMVEVLKRKTRFADIAKAGFKTVRIPICFGAWATLDEPFAWENPQNLAMADSMVLWATQNNLIALIDLHHTEFDNAEPARTTSDNRMAWLWQQIATRYKNTDPEKIFFELRNEPHDMAPAVWRTQAERLISVVRKITPNHTIIAGATEWNGLDALNKFEPFADNNIIYTFHFYDPFIFTHQGATWAGDGLPDLKLIPFPYIGAIGVPAAAKGTWVESAINNYKNEGNKDYLFNRLKIMRAWSDAKNVPVFCGEGGSYNLNATNDSRCNHAVAILSSAGAMDIPFCWWEWDGGFTMFYKDNFGTLLPCMKDAIQSFSTPVTALETLPKNMEVGFYPNPVDSVLELESNIKHIEINDLSGKNIVTPAIAETQQANVGNLSAGLYLLYSYDNQQRLVWVKKMVKL